MPLQNIRNAEYSRQAAKMAVMTMQAAINAYLQQKSESKNKMPVAVEKAVHQLEHDLQQLLEDINDVSHHPRSPNEYFDRAMDFSNRKTGAKGLDTGKDDVLSMRKQVLDSLDEFEDEYKEGTDLEIESNRSLAKGVAMAMKDALEEFRTDPSTVPLPKFDLYPNLDVKKGIFSFDSAKPQKRGEPIEELVSALIELEMQIDDNHVPAANQGTESDEDREIRHNTSLAHLAQVEELSTKLTGNADVDTVLKKAVAEKIEQWKNNTSKAPAASEKYRRQDTNLTYRPKK